MCSEVELLGGDWIMRTLISSFDSTMEGDRNSGGGLVEGIRSWGLFLGSGPSLVLSISFLSWATTR